MIEPGLRDPKRELPEDIERIAGSLPASSAAAAMRSLIGLLPRPIAAGFPAPAGEPPGADPADVAAGQVGNGFGSTPGSTIGDGTVVAASFASSIKPVLLVSSLPVLPNASYPVDTIVFNTTDRLLYKNDANVWVKVVNTGELSGTISAAQIAAGAVTAGKIAANAVTAGTIAAAAVSTTELAAGSITTAKLVVNGIDISQIAQADSIDGADIMPNTITANEIQAASITGDRISGGTITGVNIIAGAGGYDGFHVADAGGSTIGNWTSATGLAADDTIISQQYVAGVQGVATVTAAGSGSFPVSIDGMLAVDTASGTFGRFYAFHSGGWHYVAFTAGFVIPAHETVCPACGNLLEPDQDLIGTGDRYEEDGALHGLWKHLSCAGVPLGKLADDYYAAGRNRSLFDSLLTIARGLQEKLTPRGPRR